MCSIRITTHIYPYPYEHECILSDLRHKRRRQCHLNVHTSNNVEFNATQLRVRVFYMYAHKNKRRRKIMNVFVCIAHMCIQSVRQKRRYREKKNANNKEMKS